jgi:hypothetical protein
MNNLWRISIAFLVSGVFLSPVRSQNLSAFTDYKDYFYVFDNGAMNQAEYLPVKTYKVGGNSVAYVDNSDNFKAFYNGKAYELADLPPTTFYATNNLVVYFSNRVLSVFDNGKITRLPGWVTQGYVYGDSIVGYYDENGDAYNVYHDGKVEPLPDMIDNASLTTFVAGGNLLGYKAADGNLKVFFHGKVYDTGTSHATFYKGGAGANTIPFMDEYSQLFKVFYNGTITNLENIPPKSVKVGDDLVAYVDRTGNFKIFYQGNLTTISTTEQDFYTVAGNVVVFGTEDVQFSVFWKGKIYKLENNLPTSHQEDYNSVGYVDTYGYLKIFTEGQQYQASQIMIPKFTLTKNVLKYKIGVNDYHFYLNGVEY